MPRPKLEDARSRLLVAGLGLFASLGSERVNSNAIARAAGLGIGTFYLYFANKYAVLRELQLRTLAGLRDARAGARDPVDPIRGTIAAAIEFAREHAEAYRICFGRERAVAAHHGPVLSESTRPIADALRALQKVGEIDATLDAELAARAYLAMEAGLILWWLEDPKRAQIDALIETLLRMHPAQTARRTVSPMQ